MSTVQTTGIFILVVDGAPYWLTTRATHRRLGAAFPSAFARPLREPPTAPVIRETDTVLR
jgi:hypothetical protein